MVLIRLANTSSVFGRRDASYIQQIEGQTTVVRKCGSFLKVSVVYPWYKLLSNAGGLWSVFLPLSVRKLVNEVVEESQRLVNPIWQGYEKTLGSVTLVCRYPSWYPFHEEVSKERKIEKILRLVNAAISGLPAGIFLTIK